MDSIGLPEAVFRDRIEPGRVFSLSAVIVEAF